MLQTENAAASEEEVQAIIEGLPLWSGPVGVSPLAGGITNRNYVVADPDRGRFVVRFGVDIPLHGVMRFNELSAARAAHAAGLSPEVVYAAPGLMVSRCLEGRSLTAAEAATPERIGQIVELLRLCHCEVARHLRGPVLAFWVFHVIRSYIATLRDEDARIEPRLGNLERQADELERAIGPIDLVFAHNDLLAGNLFDDGSRLWLLDWDYAGFNSPLFDLANFASNNRLAPDQETHLLRLYFGEAGAAGRLAPFRAMACASLLREALWSAVCERHSTIPFDYVAYTDANFDTFDQAWAKRRAVE